ncbi:uncharacterized protein EI97DRAFT_444219 [Westerdykella ornata]|uniref:Uncharacterized protein n=1 Tax=Westerdykella ornata TaxID=318751 RepID=A0A6A6JEZ7_WESOR|nr:uncharacterized protein EI97DRAFT_444219 [Westerdykella ornata]KAF2274206.1 hypothetical protein EI97DRAFT_444219 [Westerdykella ornata]
MPPPPPSYSLPSLLHHLRSHPTSSHSPPWSPPSHEPLWNPTANLPQHERSPHEFPFCSDGKPINPDDTVAILKRKARPIRYSKHRFRFGTSGGDFKNVFGSLECWSGIYGEAVGEYEKWLSIRERHSELGYIKESVPRTSGVSGKRKRSRRGRSLERHLEDTEASLSSSHLPEGPRARSMLPSDLRNLLRRRRSLDRYLEETEASFSHLPEGPRARYNLRRDLRTIFLEAVLDKRLRQDQMERAMKKMVTERVMREGDLRGEKGRRRGYGEIGRESCHGVDTCVVVWRSGLVEIEEVPCGLSLEGGSDGYDGDVSG